MRVFIKAGLLVILAAVVMVGVAAAADGQVSGTMVGDHGGAHMTWDLNLPAATDVTITLAHWPCDIGDAVSFDVWSATDHLASSSQATSCTQEASFNTGDGGPAKLIMHNYLHGVGTWYSLSATGIELPGAQAPAPVVASEEAKEAAPAEGVATTAEPVVAAVPAETVPVVVEPVAAAAPAAEGVIVDNATVLGDIGGAYGTHVINAEAGKTYKVTMVYGTPVGGTWTGVGFKVWGPEGLVAVGDAPDLHNANEKTATFTAESTGPYTIQVYNYHHGLVLFYSLEVTEETAE
jgi:hypothetical protein